MEELGRSRHANMILYFEIYIIMHIHITFIISVLYFAGECVERIASCCHRGAVL